MEHDSSRSGYHEPEPGSAGLSATEEDWGDDYPKTFSVNLIWGEARDKEGRAGAIGLNGGMSWHCAEDMKHFKELTVSHPVIMGRKTRGRDVAGSRSGRVAYARQGGVRHRFLSFPYLGQNQVSMRIRLMPFIAA